MSDGTMDRRAFLEHATVGCVVLAAPRGLPGFAPGVSGPTGQLAAPFELEEVTIAALQAGLESGKYTARSLVTAYLQRIDELDRRGPTLRAVLEANPDALAQAAALDAERKAKGPRGPLDRKSTRLNSSHVRISYAVFCLNKKPDLHRPRRATRPR